MKNVVSRNGKTWLGYFFTCPFYLCIWLLVRWKVIGIQFQEQLKSLARSMKQISKVNLRGVYSSGVLLTCDCTGSSSGLWSLEDMNSYDPPWRHRFQHCPPLFLPPFKLEDTCVWQMHTMQSCEGAVWQAGRQSHFVGFRSLCSCRLGFISHSWLLS